MEKFVLNTPVALFFFNRPETTAQVFEAIRQAKPKKLLLVSDGPRSNKENEEARCREARNIVENVDWDCEVLKNYSDNNLGCKGRLSSGLNWVFENAEEAIILEDDCLPHPTFFRYCQELLEHYRNDQRIMMISGDNFQGRKLSSDSYYFSAYSHIWGWASWKRAWDKYDVDMKLWPEVKKKKYLTYWLSSKKIVEHWEEEFDRLVEGRINTWDYQFQFMCWVNSGLCIIPQVNLVSNIGFGAGAEHTHNAADSSSNIPVEEMLFPLKHPEIMMRSLEADRYEEENHYLFNFVRRTGRKIKRKLSGS